jgi:hypothetical protein
MPGLHWHLYIFLKRIFNLLADFLKNFTNINIVTTGCLISELDTSSLTKALTVMKAFLTQVDLAQSTNTPVLFGRGSISKYKVNPVNNTRFAPQALIMKAHLVLILRILVVLRPPSVSLPILSFLIGMRGSQQTSV